MRPRDRKLAQQLESRLLSFDREARPLPGIRDLFKREVFIEQLLESVRRVNYVSVISTRQISSCRADPDDERFDPLKAAILYQRKGDIDETFWLVFLFVHFGKSRKHGWRYVREVYGRLGDGKRWDWVNVSINPTGFRNWLATHRNELKGGFGNHRKRQSLDAHSPTGTGAAVESYVNWVNPPRTHKELMDEALEDANGDPHKTFDALYRSIDAVASFGRTARFDYLTMVGKLGLAPIKPGSTYMQGATGPLDGARLLFADDKAAALGRAELDKWLIQLDAHINVGMQVLEDALCNWQKSPRSFKVFRG